MFGLLWICESRKITYHKSRRSGFHREAGIIGLSSTVRCMTVYRASTVPRNVEYTLRGDLKNIVKYGTGMSKALMGFKLRLWNLATLLSGQTNACSLVRVHLDSMLRRMETFFRCNKSSQYPLSRGDLSVKLPMRIYISKSIHTGIIIHEVIHRPLICFFLTYSKVSTHQYTTKEQLTIGAKTATPNPNATTVATRLSLLKPFPKISNAALGATRVPKTSTP